MTFIINDGGIRKVPVSSSLGSTWDSSYCNNA